MQIHLNTAVPTTLIADNNSVDPTATGLPGFKELRKRVNRFADDGKEDFEVWLTDYYETTDGLTS